VEPRQRIQIADWRNLADDEERYLQRPQRPARRPAKPDRYQWTMTVASVVAAMLFWIGMWVLNGLLSVRFLARFSVGAWIAAAVQVLITLTEVWLWRARIRALYPMVFVVGLADAFMSAYEIQMFLRLTGLTGATIATIVAMCIGLASEPMITRLVKWLKANV
jgi:hypothetical protein